MAVYKVPQDVEAEDKLLGPFSFRQFVYLIIAGLAAFVGWLMYNIAPFFVVIPIPIIIFFVILALPLRKDQPMEIFLIAVVQYLLKPKHRLWDPDGIISHVQLVVPKITEVQRTKDLSESEAVDKLSYLARIMDTHGWAARGVTQPAVPANTSMNDAVVAEAQAAEDMLDTSASVSQSFDTLIHQQTANRRQNMMERMHQTPATLAPSPPRQDDTAIPHIPSNPYDTFLQQGVAAARQEPAEPAPVRFNPYPTAIRQQVIQPYRQQTRPSPVATPAPPPPQAPVVAPQPRADHATQKNASEIEVSPDILGLVNNADLSISTMAKEARRIQEREQQNDGEVVISLH